MSVAGEILEQLMATAEKDEWQSISLNITAGPNEAPVIIACILPGTTSENAQRIQKGCASAFAELG
jgi:hypothetical protein